MEENKKLTILDLIPPFEGALRQYYGRIGNGKTYCATVDVLNDLKHGQVVYANWPIQFDGYDERKTFFGKIFGKLNIKKNFLYVPKENLHYIQLDNLDNVIINGVSTGKNFYDWFKSLTSCSVYLDEGHIYYDSYLTTHMKLQDRVSILDTRHYDRSVNIISQRPTAIHVTLRANVVQFFKCEKILDINLLWRKKWNIKKFRKTEFQDTKNDIPDESREEIRDPQTGEIKYGDYLLAVTQKEYFGRKKIYAIYDTKFRRGATPESQENKAQIITKKGEDILKLNMVK